MNGLNLLSLRWRLTLYYGGMLGLILLIGGLGFWLALRSSLYQTLDTSLRDASALAASQLGGDETSSETRIATFEREVGATTILVFDAQQHITEGFGTLRVNAPLEPGAVSLNGMRVFTLQLANGEWIQAIRRENEVLGALGQAQRLLLLGVPVLLLTSLGAGYLITDRALRPMDRVTKLASSIAAGGHYRERVPLSPGNDELTRLTQTVNAMLTTLEGTIQRERAFALAAAHELRSPLTVLHGRASLTLERDLSPEQYKKAVRQMLQISAELGSMIESLLTLARHDQALPRNDLNLADVALEAVQIHRANAEMRGIRLELDLQTALLLGDHSSLRVVAANLVTNAIQYGRDNGMVWLRTCQDQTHAVLEVSDDGGGIDPNELERLQQPFQRGHGVQGQVGSGMGLALVKAIVEQHGGQFELSQASAGGLNARARFPRLQNKT
jgi:signal transduction histidine kinase